MPNKEQITDGLKALQDRICVALELMDGEAKFQEDLWQRDGGGGGRTRVIQDGTILSKGGVNFSAVYGDMPAHLNKTLGIAPSPRPLTFYATGVSIVLHPRSPMTPISHMNVRYFEVSNGLWWFGGGIDLTPHYVDLELAQKFHQRMNTVCTKYHHTYYKRFKDWCDDYFYIKHRKEMRGVGGIFFDRLGAKEPLSKDELFDFIIEVGDNFAPMYIEQVSKTKDRNFGEQELAWQALRRGRYVEFNLVWDRGTQFGLQTNGRTESILMSMPPTANWAYNHQPKSDSAEAKTLQWLKKGIDWLALDTHQI